MCGLRLRRGKLRAQLRVMLLQSVYALLSLLRVTRGGGKLLFGGMQACGQASALV
jgi:hypothetical protein